MRRVHLLEIEDQTWCPRPVRDGATDWLQFMANAHKAFNTMAPKLRDAMRRVGCNRIVDLCSGGGGPWASLGPELGRSGDVRVELTDFYPNLTAFERLAQQCKEQVSYCPYPVDATDVPPGFEGVRTLFSSFHHFKPAQARDILADAVRKRRPIVVVEGSDTRLLGIVMILLMPLAMLLLTLRIRPFRWSRVLLTYLLPAIPLLILWDGIVSMLRIYSPRELHELVAGIPGSDAFDWDIGIQPVRGSPLGLTYLVGIPRSR
jgi:hypothetical protein